MAETFWYLKKHFPFSISVTKYSHAFTACLWQNGRWIGLAAYLMFRHCFIILTTNNMKIEIISGSPRQHSSTHRLAIYLQKALAASDHSIGIIDVREAGLPLLQKVFTSVTEAPAEYKELAQRMFDADAFIIVTPEYNGSYSPAMQNLFDHFPKQHHKTFGLATASPGALGGIRAAMQLQQFVLALFGIPSPYMLVTPHVDKKFSADGELTDPAFQKSIDLFIKEFLWLSEKLTAPPPPKGGVAAAHSQFNQNATVFLASVKSEALVLENPPLGSRGAL